MKNYLRPYTMCTKVETEGYLLAGTGGGSAGSIKPAGSMALPVVALCGKKELKVLVHLKIISQNQKMNNFLRFNK